MGIPSIIGAKGLLSKVKNGDLIEMNGGTGTIKLLLEHE
jgi:dihydroxyacid dehydratase/phosphogluconate dehydratase